MTIALTRVMSTFSGGRKHERRLYLSRLNLFLDFGQGFIGRLHDNVRLLPFIGIVAAMQPLDWILLGLVAWVLGGLIALLFLRMAGDQDRAARHAQKAIDPYSDVTITRTAGW